MTPFGRALWHIETHYIEELTQGDLAAIAGVSRFHLSLQAVTAKAVQLEIGAAFSRLAYRSLAAAILEALDRDPSITVVSLDDDI